MPDSLGKRERLVASARELLHQQGLQRTTLAQIADAADVPPGNVYYYFKTRDELVGAVIDEQTERARALIARLERRRTPARRLKGLVQAWAESAERVAAHGCPIGSLCSELNKHGGPPAGAVLELLIDWAATQLRELGSADPREDAMTLMAGVQGAALLADTFNDPALMKRQTKRLARWIDEQFPDAPVSERP